MISRPKIIFCGLDESTYDILISSHDLNVVAVNYLADLRHFKSFNVVDLLFKRLYTNLYHKNFFFLNKILMFILHFSFQMGSRMTRKYFFYVKNILKHSIDIIDFSNESATKKYIDGKRIELMIVSNWWLLSEAIIFAPTHGTINIHPSKLPEYRGSLPTLWSLKFNHADTAVTLIKLNSKIDGGDIISQHDLTLDQDEDSISLEKKCNILLKKYLISDIKNYLSGMLVPMKQDQRKASFTAKYYEYLKINWQTETSTEIVNKIKLYPYLWPVDCCYTYYNHKKIIFYNAELSSKVHNNALPGTGIIYLNRLYIKTLDGFIKLNLFKDLLLCDSIKLFFRKKLIFRFYNIP